MGVFNRIPSVKGAYRKGLPCPDKASETRRCWVEDLAEEGIKQPHCLARPIPQSYALTDRSGEVAAGEVSVPDPSFPFLSTGHPKDSIEGFMEGFGCNLAHRFIRQLRTAMVCGRAPG